MSSIEELGERYGPSYRWLVTGTAMLALTAVIASATIINVAIPEIMGAFGISQIEAQWLSAGFLAATTTTMLLLDWSIKAFGIRATIIGSLIFFIAGCFLGGLAPNEQVLIAARILQGAAAGVMQPLAMLLVFQVFPPEQRGVAMGIFGGGVVLVPGLGPWAGGVLIDLFNWRYVFYMAVPPALIGIVMGYFFLPTRQEKGPIPSFDWFGTVLLSLFLLSLLSAFSDGQRDGWTSDISLLKFAVAALMGGGFVFWETHIDKPMLDLRIFLNMPFLAASILSCVMGAGLYGSTYLLPLFLQTIQGLTPAQSGEIMVLPALAMLVGFPLAGWLSDRVSGGLLISGGLIIVAFSSYLMTAISIHTGVWSIIFWTLLSRIGLGLLYPSLIADSLRVLPPEQLPQGSGASNFTRQLGATFGVNLLAVFVQRRTVFHSDALAATLTSDNDALMTHLSAIAHMIDAAGVPPLELMPAGMVYLARSVLSEASVLAFQDGFLAVCVMTLLALIPTWILHRAVQHHKRQSAAPSPAGPPGDAIPSHST